MIKKPRVSIIITNYNGGQVFWDCLKSVEKINYPNFEVVVVDDGSKDGSFENAKNAKWKQDISFFKNKKNLGFAGANNRGYGESVGDYVLLLNNDTTVDNNLLTKLVDRFEQDLSLGAAQAKIHLMDQPTHLDNAGSFLTRTGFLVHWGFGSRDSKEFSKEKEIFSAKGACLFIRRKVIEKVGLFDVDFVSYIEESDFCWRVWLNGWRIIFYPGTFIHHKVGYTFSKQFNPIKVNYNSFKNRILSLYKNLDSVNLVLILIPHILIIICLAFYYIFRFQFNKAGMIFKALWWNLVNYKKSVIKRRKIQSMRTMTDKEIFKIILKKFEYRKMLKHFIKVEANFK